MQFVNSVIRGLDTYDLCQVKLIRKKLDESTNAKSSAFET